MWSRLRSRGAAMAPNLEWDDFALTRQFEALDKRLDGHDDALRGLAHFPIDVATAALNIEHLGDQIRSTREEIAGVAHSCERMREDWQKALDARQKGRTAMVVAVITGCFTVLAALVVLVGSLAG
jgi:hypothetical protein